MYRLVMFFIAVAVLVGLVFSGGILVPETNSAYGSDDVGKMIAHSEQQLQDKADEELAALEKKAAPISGEPIMLPAVKPPLSEADIIAAVQRGGEDAQQIALRVGQSTEQALNAKQDAETLIRLRMERQMQQEQQVRLAQ